MMSDTVEDAWEEIKEEEEEEDWSAALTNEPVNMDKTVEMNNESPQRKGEISVDHNKDISKCPGTKMGENNGADTKPVLTRMLLNDNKAGMEGLDREKINKIIYEASKGSRFFESEKKKEEQLDLRIEEQRRQLEKLTPFMIEQGVAEADQLLEELEKNCNLTRTIVHVDMDAFYAAVEMRDNPILKEKPMAVGSNSMLSTSNYLARRFGVRAAMPGFIARKLCPQLIIVPTHFDKYKAVSKDVRDILYQYDPEMCPMSLDEAYLDFTEHMIKRLSFTEKDRSFVKTIPTSDCCICKQNDGKTHDETNIDLNNSKTRAEGEEADTAGKVEKKCDSSSLCRHCGLAIFSPETETFGLSVEEAVREMRFQIHQKTKLTASAGIAPNTMLAKVCSDKNKPNGQYRIQPTRTAVMEFVKMLPIRKVSGIGKVSAKMLSALAVTNCCDLYTKRGVLFHLYSELSFDHFMTISLGIGSTRVERDTEKKSISTERTFKELSQPSELYQKCNEMCVALSEDMQEEQLMGKTVTLKIKLVNFEQKTRAHTLRNHTQHSEQIYAAAKELLRVEIQASSPQPLRLRLMGVRMSNLMQESEFSSMQKQATITDLFQNMKGKPMRNVGEHQSALVLSKVEPRTSAVTISPRKNERSPRKSIQDFLSSQRSKQNSTTRTDSNVTVEHIDSCDDTDFPDTVKENSKFMCPVCASEITCENLGGLNNHIDICLEQNSSQNNTQGHSQRHVDHSGQSGDNDKRTREADYETSPTKVLTCPICDKQQPTQDLHQFNLHVDSCLNKDTVRQLVDQQDRELSDTRKRQVDTDVRLPANKKRKNNACSSASIHSFFH